MTDTMPTATLRELPWLGGRAELWAVSLETTPSGSHTAWLSADERARAARFVFERDRVRYLHAHLWLREALAARTGLPPQQLAYDIGRHGKPSLAGGGCVFSMSHSGALAWIVVADHGDIGVDVELLRATPDADDLAARLYTDGERETIARAGPEGRDLAFMTCWTRKEACLKALGVGLLVEPATFDAGAFRHASVARITTPAGDADVDVRSIVLDDGTVGAVAHVLPPGGRRPQA